MKSKVRKHVLLRDGLECQDCGRQLVADKYEEGPTAQVHHIKPKAEGGEDSVENLITLCRSCHLTKHTNGVGGEYLDAREHILDVFQQHGYATTGMLVDETGYSRPTVSKRLDRLHAAGKIEYIHEPTALWRLVADPRETNTDE